MSAPLPEPFSTEVFTPGCFTAQGKIRAGGQTVSFRSIAEDFVFYAPENAGALKAVLKEKIPDLQG